MSPRRVTIDPRLLPDEADGLESGERMLPPPVARFKPAPKAYRPKAKRKRRAKRSTSSA